MHRVSYRIAGCPRLWTRDPILVKAHRQMSGVTEGSGSSDLRRGSMDAEESGPRKKSRKSTIMEALRRGTSQTNNTPGPSRQMSTVASVSHSRFRSFQYQTRSKSPTAISRSSVSSTGLPFYTHTESLDSSSLPALSTSRVEYIRDMDQANYAIAQLIDRMEPFPGSRWRGVVGFDMEWTVRIGMAQRKTGLIQVSDASTILLIQISSMESFPHKLKELITSAIILKVGVNIGADMKKLCRDFGPSYAARGALDLSHLARAVDVGLVGTTMEDLDSSRASLGVGISKNLDSTQANNLLDTNIEEELSDEENSQATIENDSATITKKEGTNEVVRSGRKLISFARLVRRYLARELEKGDVRTSNWETRLSEEQKQYAANDAHAGLALYYALRKVHSLAVTEGVIPVPSPPPWGDDLNANTTEVPPSGPGPAPPPFRARATTYKAAPLRKFVPASELQHLTPAQLESLLPWGSLIQDLQAEFEEARAAVLVKRKKEGVDLKGRGEAVVAAEEAVELAKLTDTPSLAHTSDANNITTGKKVVPNPLGNTYYDSPRPGSVYPPSKGITHASLRRQAHLDKQNEVLGKKWPPTRSFPSRSTESLSRTPPIATPSLSKPVSEAAPSSDSDDEVEFQPPQSAHPPLPTRSVNSPAPSSGARPSPQQLRAYLLWHKQQLPLAEICASLRSVRYPLANSTVISYVVQALQADEELPFESTRLKELVSLDTTNRVRAMYRQFLESKIGLMGAEES
ncbi:hypothetical protein ACGC1H_006245 [Rhizoctonia solani]|uniref:3'-5' exonuclease domain-containing protein n=1 Tax=Rhizoctonia solani TaxID=456999 RepID=A0A8H3GWH4_9AGAM|nr:unnamed protein product [Rhizoctonia solani]